MVGRLSCFAFFEEPRVLVILVVLTVPVVLLLEGALAQVGLVDNRREVSAALARRLGVFRGLDRGGLQQRGMVGFHSGRVLESSTGRVYDSGVLRA